MQDIAKESLLEPLGLHHTTYTVPNDTRNGVIPVNTTASGWSSQLGALSP